MILPCTHAKARASPGKAGIVLPIINPTIPVKSSEHRSARLVRRAGRPKRFPSEMNMAMNTRSAIPRIEPDGFPGAGMSTARNDTAMLWGL